MTLLFVAQKPSAAQREVYYCPQPQCRAVVHDCVEAASILEVSYPDWGAKVKKV